MNRLYIIYDSQCGLCVHCKKWMEAQPAFLELRFIPRNAPELICRFPGIEKFLTTDELVVVGDEGELYQGASAWIMCLYALQNYRELAQKFSHPVLFPFARRFFIFISKKRGISRLLIKDLNEKSVDDIASSYSKLLAKQPPPIPHST